MKIMRISIKIKLNEKKLKKFMPNPIYQYAELIEVLREHGFVHKTPLDFGFINDDATVEQVRIAIADALEKLGWLNIEGMIAEFKAVELGESVDITFPLDGSIEWK